MHEDWGFLVKRRAKIEIFFFNYPRQCFRRADIHCQVGAVS